VDLFDTDQVTDENLTAAKRRPLLSVEVRREFGEGSGSGGHVSADPGWGSITDDNRGITERGGQGLRRRSRFQRGVDHPRPAGRRSSGSGYVFARAHDVLGLQSVQLRLGELGDGRSDDGPVEFSADQGNTHDRIELGQLGQADHQ
jgi:hypothetical protein